ncbi:S1 family peptidase [Aestuariibacter halophilus]|uniref:S1 family peptidase n=1 Tax=Fluctibacter halophilus TaxID=226011 RepID=A0ABS8G8C0_9ALTE|nr:S1 family peptidase [Aestuariibacter halophilus]MCC2616065.1 S1 family peptidase [Aestuariibacter halophilus]
MKNMIRLMFAGALSLLAGHATAVTWGQPDGNEHPNVGTLLFVQNGVGFFSCTGTMIAPRVMLTAAHCVSEAGNTNDLTYVRFNNDALAGIGDYPSLQGWFDNEWMATETVIAHPNWTDYGEFPATYDIGVVILSEPYYPSNGFASLPPMDFLENLRGRDRQSFVAVGYGRQGTLPPTQMNDYERYRGTVRLLEVNSYLSGSGEASAKFSNNPGIGGGTCYGDSGGPTFFKDSNMVVAVTSFGWAKNGNCVGNDFNYRTDTDAARSFLDDVLSQYGD